jgi:hypothetical protein
MFDLFYTYPDLISVCGWSAALIMSVAWISWVGNNEEEASRHE